MLLPLEMARQPALTEPLACMFATLAAYLVHSIQDRLCTQ